MEKRAVLLCRAENGDKQELKRIVNVLDAFARRQGWFVSRIFAETGSLGSLTLWDLRLMAKGREFDYLILEDFDTFSLPPDETMEEVRYLIENGVEVKTVKDGDLTCESLPTLFRNRFKIFAGGKKNR